jgi:hypothetical protein
MSQLDMAMPGEVLPKPQKKSPGIHLEAGILLSLSYDSQLPLLLDFFPEWYSH